MWTVYVIYDVMDGDYRYVGITSGSLRYRYNMHMSNKRSCVVGDWMRFLRDNGQKNRIGIKSIKFFKERSAALKYEEKFIKNLSKTSNLLNRKHNSLWDEKNCRHTFEYDFDYMPFGNKVIKTKSKKYISPNPNQPC